MMRFFVVLNFFNAGFAAGVTLAASLLPGPGPNIFLVGGGIGCFVLGILALSNIKEV